MRQTHRKFNESSNDLYQYSVMMDRHALMIEQGYYYVNKNIEAQVITLCNRSDDDENLRAVLRNVTLPCFV
jgi:hypothetical protein